MDETLRKTTVFNYSQFIEEIIGRTELSLKQAAYILDAACGPGLISFALLDKHPNIHVEGIDLTEEMLIMAEKGKSEIERNERINFQKASIEEIPFPGHTFDIVICSMVIHHTRVDKSLGELLRVTKPGGKLIIADPGLAEHFRRFPGNIIWRVFLFFFSIRKKWRAERDATILSRSEWKNLLLQHGLTDISIKDIGKKNPWLLRLFIISARNIN